LSDERAGGGRRLRLFETLMRQSGHQVPSVTYFTAFGPDLAPEDLEHRHRFEATARHFSEDSTVDPEQALVVGTRLLGRFDSFAATNARVAVEVDRLRADGYTAVAFAPHPSERHLPWDLGRAEILQTDLPLELHLLAAELLPALIVGFPTSAMVTLDLVLPSTVSLEVVEPVPWESRRLGSTPPPGTEDVEQLRRHRSDRLRVRDASPPGLRAIVLDFDGVVLQSDQIKTDAFAELFGDHPEAVAEIIALHERYGGLSRYRKFDMIYESILQLPLDDATRGDLGKEYSRIVLDKVLECPMVDGALAFLRANPPDRPIYISSGSPHDELLHTIEHRGLAPFITEASGSPNEKPDVIGGILDRERCSPDEVVFVGDAWSDFDAATRTGVRFVGVVRPDRSSPFPEGTVTVPDLVALEDVLHLATHPSSPDPLGDPDDPGPDDR
jgi:beta-phosphoglucomutase-like phosphatase (HAD superfamily)